VLLLGAPGSGKSDLLLRLLDRPGWRLVGDDRLILHRDDEALLATAPAALGGMLEVRGLGLLEGLAREDHARLRLAVACVNRDAVPRLPQPRRWDTLGLSLPLVAIDPFTASAPKLVELALDGARGAGPRWHAGAFGGTADASPAPVTPDRNPEPPDRAAP